MTAHAVSNAHKAPPQVQHNPPQRTQPKPEPKETRREPPADNQRGRNVDQTA